jgi:site-specific DNA-cytosine methylase
MVCYDARGHGDGDVVPSLIGAGRTNDYMPVVVQGVEKLKSYAIAENIINRINYGVTGPGIKEELQFTLNASKPHGVCCFVKNNTSGLCSDNLAPTLRQQAEHAVSYQSIVRRLMPVETERLMGFPDNHTRIEWNGKPEADCPDTPRYKACGNSFPVNSVRWIGMRIELVNEVAQNIEDKDV